MITTKDKMYIIKIIYMIVFLGVLLTSIVLPIKEYISQKEFKAVKGVMNLSNFQLNSKNAVRLDGEWEFYWNQLLSPRDFEKNNKNVNTPKLSGYYKVPEAWDSYILLDGETISSKGYATYRLNIKTKEINKGLYGIKTVRIRESDKIFVNGKEVGHSGIPGRSYEESVPKTIPYTSITELSGDNIEIIIQVSNFRYYNGGIIKSIYFGNYDSINHFNQYRFSMDLLIFCGYIFTGIYFMALYLQRREQNESLFFALYCIFAAIYFICNGEKLIFSVIPSLSYETYYKIITLSSSLSECFSYHYIYRLYRENHSKKLLKFFNIYNFIKVLLVMNASISFSSSLSWVFGLFSVIGIAYNIFMMLGGVMRAGGEYVYALTSTICFIEIQMVSFLSTFWTLENTLIPPVAIPLFILSQGLLMSQRFTEAYKKVEQLSEKLTDMDKTKDEFMAKISHELRTPLNGIINISQSLLDGGAGKINKEQQENLTIIADKGRRLSNLVNGILDYSRVKNGNIVLDKTNVDLEAVVSLIFKIVSYSIKDKDLALRSNIKPDEFFIWADENRLKQIMYNLVENAVKFTKEGKVTVSARKINGNIIISVKDTGIGIPKQMHKDIFKSFEQVSPKDINNYTGTGLGLPITKQLVEIQGGKIWVKSEEGTGSEFIFTLKEAENKNVKPIKPKSYEKPDILDRLVTDNKTKYKYDIGGEFSILTVDDEVSNLKVLLNVLLMEKFNVTAITSGEEALKELEGKLKYDLCILDIMMPGVSGIDVCKKIREKYSPVDLPVLMLTAKSQPSDLQLGFEAGANDFLVKPYELSELKARVNTLVQLKKTVGSVVASETAFLQAQINPHFLYNALSIIASLTTREPLKSKELILDLSDYLRGSFDFDVNDNFVFMSKELEIVNAYLAIEKARFKDRLKVEINISGDVKIKIPRLTIQPLVENALRHGILKKVEGGIVKISIKRDQNYVKVEVEDNGIGITKERIENILNSKDKKAGVGLVNINRRLINYYGYGLQIESNLGIGTRVSMMFPV